MKTLDEMSREKSAALAQLQKEIDALFVIQNLLKKSQGEVLRRMRR